MWSGPNAAGTRTVYLLRNTPVGLVVIVVTIRSLLAAASRSPARFLYLHISEILVLTPEDQALEVAG